MLRPSTIPQDLDEWLALLSRQWGPISDDPVVHQRRIAALAQEVASCCPWDYFHERRGNPDSDISSSNASDKAAVGSALKLPDVNRKAHPSTGQPRFLNGSTPASRHRRSLIIRSVGKPL